VLYIVSCGTALVYIVGGYVGLVVNGLL
jgi:hypothetical protein